MIVITLSREVPPADLAQHIAHNSTNDELFELITTLDETACDWDFTKRLADHFNAEIVKSGEFDSD